jgi:hypothetical protein
MADPQMRPQARARAKAQGDGGGLWREAPGWRNLSLLAVGLTAAAAMLVNAPGVPTGPGAAPPPAGAAAPPAAAPPAAPPTVAPGHAAQPAEQPKAVAATAPAPAPVQTPAPPPAAPPVRLANIAPQPAQQSQVQPQLDAQPQVCLLTAPSLAHLGGAGVILSFEDRAISLSRIPLTQASVHGQIDPAYVDNVRVNVKLDSGRAEVFLVPKSLAVKVGDRVSVQGLYRNYSLPCNYIPGQVVADLGPAPPAAAPAAPSTPPQP